MISEHLKIKFLVLSYLYNRYYADEPYQTQIVENMIEETELKNVDRNAVYDDIIHLERSELIHGEHTTGTSYPPRIKITNFGIELVEKINNEITQTMQIQIKDEKTRIEIENIAKESNAQLKAQKMSKYIKANPSFFNSTIERILGSFLN